MSLSNVSGGANVNLPVGRELAAVAVALVFGDALEEELGERFMKATTTVKMPAITAPMNAAETAAMTCSERDMRDHQPLPLPDDEEPLPLLLIRHPRAHSLILLFSQRTGRLRTLPLPRRGDQ